MLPITKILWPTDFSEPSYEALKVAGEMALHFSAELILAHVVTPIPVIPIHDDPTSFNLPLYEKEMEASAEKSMARISKKRVSQEVNQRSKVVYGDPATQIVRLATDETVDLIVIATHGLTGWRKFMFGSVTEKVIRMSPHPVLSIRIPTDEH
ncbi:MAG TPA: universal stress protein [Deltaproteobacteria bacterium]|nr:universal stress protein [Deltaproteobacteria bacterium]